MQCVYLQKDCQASIDVDVSWRIRGKTICVITSMYSGSPNIRKPCFSSGFSFHLRVSNGLLAIFLTLDLAPSTVKGWPVPSADAPPGTGFLLPSAIVFCATLTVPLPDRQQSSISSSCFDRSFICRLCTGAVEISVVIVVPFLHSLTKFPVLESFLLGGSSCRPLLLAR